MPNWKKVVVSGSDAFLSSVTSSFTGSLTGALIGTGSWARSALTASTILNVRVTNDANYYLTAVDSLNGTLTEEALYTPTNITYNPTRGSLTTTSVSASFTGSHVGELIGTASWATRATTASIVFTTASVDNASYFLTFVNSNNTATATEETLFTATGIVATPAARSLNIQGAVTSSAFSGQLTGSVLGSASYALTASFALNGGGGAAFPYVGLAVITGSLQVSGSNSGFSGITGSLFGTSSFAITASNADFLDGYHVNQLVLITGSASITGSLTITGSLIATGSAGGINTGNGTLLTTNGSQSLNFSDNFRASSQTYYTSITQLSTQQGLTLNHGYSGHVIVANLDGEAPPADFQPVYLETDGIWYIVTNNISGATRMLGVCVNYTLGHVLLEGDLVASINNSYGTWIPDIDHGLPIYLSATADQFVTTQPTSGVIRIIGHAYYVSGARWIVKFKPSADWYVQ